MTDQTTINATKARVLRQGRARRRAFLVLLTAVWIIVHIVLFVMGITLNTDLASTQPDALEQIRYWALWSSPLVAAGCVVLAWVLQRFGRYGSAVRFAMLPILSFVAAGLAYSAQWLVAQFS